MYSSDDYDKNKEITINQPGDYSETKPGGIIDRAVRVLSGEFGSAFKTIEELHKGS
jgi:hypothetical protein